MSSEIMNVLCEAVKIKAPKGKPDQAFLAKLAGAVEKAPDAVWDGLADKPAGVKAQKWVNEFSDREDGSKKPIKLFPDWKDGEPNSESEKGDTMSTTSKKTSKKSASAKKASKAPVAKKTAKKATATKKAATKRSDSAPSSRRVVKQIVAKNPNISVDDLEKQVKAKGYELSRLSVSSFRNDMRDSMKVLLDAGLLNEKKVNGDI